MDLKNGYKVLYARETEDGRKYYAAKNKVIADTDPEVTFMDADGVEVNAAATKLVYGKGEELYTSTSGLPSETDVAFVCKAGEELILGKEAEETPDPEEPDKVEEEEETPDPEEPDKVEEE